MALDSRTAIRASWWGRSVGGSVVAYLVVASQLHTVVAVKTIGDKRRRYHRARDERWRLPPQPQGVSGLVVYGYGLCRPHGRRASATSGTTAGAVAVVAWTRGRGPCNALAFPLVFRSGHGQASSCQMAPSTVVVPGDRAGRHGGPRAETWTAEFWRT